MASLDLVITTDTAIAHLAGALGRPAWVALRQHPEWRWLEGRDDTPWHPTLRLFRQEQDGDWAPVFRRMADGLGTLAGQREREAGRPEMPAASATPHSGGSIVLAPTSPGDLLDRITILQVKAERIGHTGKQANVLRELGMLRQARDAAGLRWRLVEIQECALRALHARLWDAENVFRGCEGRDEFGPAFVAAARTVIHGNARRAELKRAVNTALGSSLVEEKSYAR